MKHIFFTICLAGLVTNLLAQIPINIDDTNPHLKNKPLIRMALLDQDNLYLGGNIIFANDELSSPLIKISLDGTIDTSYDCELIYSIDLTNSFVGQQTILDGEIFFHDNNITTRVEKDGSVSSLLDGTYIRSLLNYRDSLLVIGGWPSSVMLLDRDGNSRVIDIGYSRDEYYFIEGYKLTDNKILIALQNMDDGVFHYHLFQDDFEEDESFEPFTLNQPGYIRHVEMLSSGEIFISGRSLEINGVTGNGIYIIDKNGSISENSYHDVDISFIDAYGNGIEYAIPLSNGNILVASHGNNSDYSQYSLGSLLPSGARDDTFINKDFTIRDNYGSFFIIRNNEDVYLIGNQNLYEGIPSSGINKIDNYGNVDPEFSLDLGGISDVYQFEQYEQGNFLMTGSFTETSNNSSALIAGFSFDNNYIFPWTNSVVYENDDIMGAAKVLRNGDLMVGAYDRSGGPIFRVYNQDGTEDLLSSNVYAQFVESPVYNIHESDDYIYATGIFGYNVNSTYRYNILKMNKNYEVISDYDPTPIFDNYDRVIFSYLDASDRLTILVDDFDEDTSRVIRLTPEGLKDNTFNDISLKGDGWSNNQMHIINDSLIWCYDFDYNSAQYINLYNLDGELLKKNLFSLNMGGSIWSGSICDLMPISDTTMIIAGSFSDINSIPRTNIALANINGAIYDDLILDITGTISKSSLHSDTLYIFGPGGIEGENKGGFFAYSLETPKVEIESIQVTENENGEIKWKQDSRIRSFEIYRSEENGNEVLLSTLPKGSDSYIDETCEINKSYTYRIVSKNLFGSNNAEVDLEIIKPLAPSDLAVYYNDGANNLTWNDNSSNEVGFSIYRDNGSGEYELIATTEPDIRTYTDKSVEIDHAYIYYVVAVSENYHSEPTELVQVDLFLPVVVVNFNGQCNYHTKTIYLSWQNEDPSVTDFIIYEAVDSYDFFIIDTVEAPSSEYTIQNKDSDKIYRYQVVSINEIGYSDPSVQVDVSCIITGIEEITKRINIFPNPSDGKVEINIGSNQIDCVQIINIYGKLTSSFIVKSSTEIEVNSLSKGIYFVNFMFDNELLDTRKLIVL